MVLNFMVLLFVVVSGCILLAVLDFLNHRDR